MQVTSTKSVSFPSLDWGITAGEARDLPADKDAQKAILAHPSIKPVKEKVVTNNK